MRIMTTAERLKGTPLVCAFNEVMQALNILQTGMFWIWRAFKSFGCTSTARKAIHQVYNTPLLRFRSDHTTLVWIMFLKEYQVPLDLHVSTLDILFDVGWSRLGVIEIHNVPSTNLGSFSEWCLNYAGTSEHVKLLCAKCALNVWEPTLSNEVLHAVVTK